MPPNNIEEPEITTEITVRTAEHELLLSFVNDIDAEYFLYWWGEKGFKDFKFWAEKKMREDNV